MNVRNKLEREYVLGKHFLLSLVFLVSLNIPELSTF
jgi:hypothetical protein